jgi:hypothetical protein
MGTYNSSQIDLLEAFVFFQASMLGDIAKKQEERRRKQESQR